jgi:primosomal protein N' (replication factor Y)
VAASRPLKLKAQIAHRPLVPSRGAHPVAQVWVDSGVAHLDGHFDYLIPKELEVAIAVGSLVEVPFNSKMVEGLVIARVDDSAIGNLKVINRLLTTVPIATPATISLIGEVAKRWICHPYDVVRSAIPQRTRLNSKSSIISLPPSKFDRKYRENRKSQYLQLPPYRVDTDILISYLERQKVSGSRLVIVPDTRRAHLLASQIPEAILLDSSLSKVERFSNFVKATQSLKSIVIGTRSAIFAPIADLEEIILIDDTSPFFYELRSPGWNARDVGLLRSKLEGSDITILGFAPSHEMARLIEIGQVRYIPILARVKVSSFFSERGELLPEGVFASIRKAKSEGNVLFLSPTKGYAQAISCSKCRNVASCECGGRVEKTSATAALSCAICEKSLPAWSCRYCQSKTPFLLKRGLERYAQEIGRAFPGVRIIESSAERMSEEVIDSPVFVLATNGAVPLTPGGYSAVVILDGQRRFSQVDNRAQERALAQLFESVGYLSPSGSLLAVLNQSHPAIAALASWKPSLYAKRELASLAEVGFPPFVRAVAVDIDSSEASTFLRGLIRAQSDGRLPEQTKFLGPSQLQSQQSRIVLLTPFGADSILIELLHEFLRKRSVSGKSAVKVRVDPYSLAK